MRIALEIIEKAQNFTLIDLNDDFRMKQGTHKDGGFPLDDAVVLAKYRQAAKEIVKQIGRTIFSGKFNLASISFPINCMSHHSLLYLIATMNRHSPIYMNVAAQTKDPVERMKHVMVTSLSFIQPCHIFDKPLNPILGETFQGYLADGSKVYMEQVTHHPPISYFFQEGPQKLYRWYGYSAFSPKAHLNSVDLHVEGGKAIEFASDGAKITYGPHQDQFFNTLFGTLIHLITGKIEFNDEQNGITAWYEINSPDKGKNRPKDYIVGEIRKDGVVVSKLFGTYFGYIDFDGQRYWDIRRMQNFDMLCADLAKEALPSDCRNRLDSIKLF
jgi:hypothetical protein